MQVSLWREDVEEVEARDEPVLCVTVQYNISLDICLLLIHTEEELLDEEDKAKQQRLLYSTTLPRMDEKSEGQMCIYILYKTKGPPASVLYWIETRVPAGLCGMMR